MTTKHLKKKDSYSDPEVEKLITGLQIDLLTTASVYGEQHGNNNMPVHEEYWRTVVFNHISAKAKSAIDSVQTLTEPVSNVMALKGIETTVSQKKQKCAASNSENKIKASICKEELKSMKPNLLRYWAYWLVFSLGFGFGAFDGFLAFDSILSAGMGLTYAVMTGLVIMGLTGVGSHYGAHLAMKAANKKSRNKRVLVQVLVAACLFGLLGIVRAHAINSNIDIASDVVSPVTGNVVLGLVLGGISLIIFCASLFFAMCVWMTDTEKEEHTQHLNMKKELKVLKKGIKAAHIELAQIEAVSTQETNRMNQICEYALASKKRIIDIANEAIALYAKINLNHRSDGLCPSFFSNPPQINF